MNCAIPVAFITATDILGVSIDFFEYTLGLVEAAVFERQSLSSDVNLSSDPGLEDWS